jgi:hypothetical protein
VSGPSAGRALPKSCIHGSFLTFSRHCSLTRGPDGKFADEDIAKILMDATEHPAGQYRARGTPGVLRVVEIMGIEQGRKWGVCTVSGGSSSTSMEGSEMGSTDERIQKILGP